MQNTEVEISKPSYTLTAKIFHWSFVILFAYGISKQINSIEQFYTQKQLLELIYNNGFSNVEFRNLSNGISAIHSGWKI